jgi:outer membrane lipoprotein-sorting protein
MSTRHVGISRAHIVVAMWVATLCSETALARDAQLDFNQFVKEFRQRRHESQMIKYALVGDVVIPKGSNTRLLAGVYENPPLFPPEDYRFPMEIRTVVDLKGRRVRKEKRYHQLHADELRYHPHYIVTIFDGEQRRAYTPRDSNSSSDYSPPERQPTHTLATSGKQFFSLYEFPVLLAHGILVDFDLDVRTLEDVFKLESLRPHGYGRHEGGSALVVRTEPTRERLGTFREYWIDLERQGAIVRWATYDSDKLTRQMDIKYINRGERWFPESWSATEYVFGKVINTYRLRVTDFALNQPVDSAIFTVEQRPGEVVWAGDGGLRRVGGDGKTLVPVTQEPNAWSWGWLWFGVVAALLIGGLLLAVRCFRRRYPLS